MKVLKIYDTMPEGWIVLEGASNTPRGYKMIWNKKSFFSKDSELGLLKIKEERIMKEVKFGYDLSRMNGLEGLEHVKETIQYVLKKVDNEYLRNQAKGILSRIEEDKTTDFNNLYLYSWLKDNNYNLYMYSMCFMKAVHDHQKGQLKSPVDYLF